MSNDTEDNDKMEQLDNGSSHNDAGGLTNACCAYHKPSVTTSII